MDVLSENFQWGHFRSKDFIAHFLHIGFIFVGSRVVWTFPENLSVSASLAPSKSVGLLVNYTFIFSHSFASTGVVTGRIKNKD